MVPSLNATTEASIDSFAVIGAFAGIVSIPVSFSGYFWSVRVFTEPDQARRIQCGIYGKWSDER
jgi:hypothetical protein